MQQKKDLNFLSCNFNETNTFPLLTQSAALAGSTLLIFCVLEGSQRAHDWLVARGLPTPLPSPAEMFIYNSPPAPPPPVVRQPPCQFKHAGPLQSDPEPDFRKERSIFPCTHPPLQSGRGGLTRSRRWRTEEEGER